MPKSKTVDIFDGRLITVWHDEDCAYIAFPYCTIHIPLEEFEDIVEDLQALASAWKLYKSRN